ncbi:MAG: hypothetical protein COW50_00865, partial [Candidatus Moranbacteria bacterium CG17_big_fil_post_rev_8_21_14_2_50_41_107]
CPPNWYIPLPSDFNNLKTSFKTDGTPQGSNLKSTLWSAWYPYTFNATDPNLNTDLSLFKAFPAGSADASGDMAPNTRGYYAHYWTSSISGANATVAVLQNTSPALSNTSVPQNTYRSVRCIKY